MDLQALLHVLWRKKWVLIIVPIFAMAGAFTVLFFGEWKFVSTAQLATGLTTSNELIDKDRNFNPFEIQVMFNNLSEMIRSRSVIGQVSYKLLKHDLKDSATAFRKFQRGKIKRKDVNFAASVQTFSKILNNKIDSLILLDPGKPQEKLLLLFMEGYGYDYESMVKDLSITRVNQSDFMELSYTSDNANLSATAVNTICTEFIRYYTATKLSSSNVSLESLESIARQRKQNLDDKVEELKTFRSRNDIFNSEAESDAKVHQLKNYEDQITDEQQKVRGLELTIASQNTRIRAAESNSGLHPNDELVSLNRRINAVNEKYIQGGQTNTVLLDSLTGLRAKLNEALRRAGDATKISPAEINALKTKRDENENELEISRANLTSLEKIYNAMRYSMGGLANAEAVGKALEKEVDVAGEENQAAQNRLNEAKAKLVTNKIAISQVLVAEPADKAESRKTIIFMLFSGVLSFVLCAFVIIAIELSDSRIKTPQRLKQKTRFRLAGILTQIGTKEFNLNTIFHSNIINTSMSEELRKIRFELLNQEHRVFLVTSLDKNAGKSFFIVALAFSLSLLKKRVLIIDTNLRNNTLTRILLAQPNFTLLLESFAKGAKRIGSPSDQTDPSAATMDLITKTQNTLIDIIGNKKTQLSPSEVIPGGDFKVLLEWLKIQYDCILLEGPGLNAFSDTKELVKFADLVVPVFSAESSIDANDTENLNYLKSLQEKLGPAVLNNVQKVN